MAAHSANPQVKPLRWAVVAASSNGSAPRNALTRAASSDLSSSSAAPSCAKRPFTSPYNESGMRKSGVVESLRTSADLSSYLEKHQLQAKLQAAMQQVVNDQPDDPMEALARIISQGSVSGERQEQERTRLEELEELFQKHHLKLLEKLQPDGPVVSSNGNEPWPTSLISNGSSRSEGGESGQHSLISAPQPC
eukprot:scaffold64764_cov66-Phaeocystis_antarctica.AAC.7